MNADFYDKLEHLGQFIVYSFSGQNLGNLGNLATLDMFKTSHHYGLYSYKSYSVLRLHCYSANIFHVLFSKLMLLQSSICTD